uniref:FAR1 domain-containing protein n=1 Tax=Romanomermis culicivorax TaxID=13658 RepID=A0A915HQ31_ROMCU
MPDSVFIYDRIKYVCKNGIRVRGNGGKGLRTGHNYDRKSKCLIVRRANFEHNHEVSDILYSFYPKQRKIPDEAITEIMTATELQANSRLLRDHICSKYGINITSKDISNARLRNLNSDQKSEVEKTIKFLEDQTTLDPSSYLKIVKFKNDGQDSSFDDFYSEIASVVSLPKKPGTSLDFILWPTTTSESLREQAILSVAFAVDLRTDRDPSQKSYKLGDFLSDHFAKCFELGRFSCFDASKRILVKPM